MKKNEKTMESAINHLKSLYPHSKPGNCQVTELDSQEKYHFAIKERDRWTETVEFFKLKFMSSLCNYI